MDEKLLPKKFFENNPLELISTACLAYCTLTPRFRELFPPALQEELEKDSSAQRVEKIREEGEKISRLENGEAVVDFMRHGFDIANREALCRKALSMQDTVFPLMLRRFRTSFLAQFVEAAADLLVQGEQVYIDQLKAMYPEIANPYAQSKACFVFGVRRQEDMLPLLLSEYEKMKAYPEQDYCQGPLFAIYLLYDQELPL